MHVRSQIFAKFILPLNGKLKELIKMYLFCLDVNPTIDWTSCHGRAIALSYALFDAPSKLFKAVDEDDIVDVVVQHSCNDRVSFP